MKLAQIRHFVAVAERGGLASTVEELGIPQTVLMRSIRELERELGAPLFQRQRKSMILTPVGQIFLRRTAAAQLELDRATDEIAQDRGVATGLVAMGLSAGAHVSILPKVLRPFHARYEDVRLRIVEGAFSKLEREIRDGSLDVYIGPIWPHQPTGDLTIEKLDDGARIVVGRKGHPLAEATSLTHLAGARWIATSRLELDMLFEQQHLPKPIVIIETETGLGMLSAVAASDALLIASATWLPLIERTGLLTPFALEGLASPTTCMITRRQLPLTPAAAYLHDLIIQTSGDSSHSS